MRMRSLLFIAKVLLMCLIPSVRLIVFGSSNAGANEVLAGAPQIRIVSGAWNLGYLSDLAGYVNDRFYLRQELITPGRKVSAALFNATGEESVILGNDGRLFYGQTLADYSGSDGLEGREVYAAAENLYLMNEYCYGQGVTFLFTAAPNKNTLYGDFMPFPGGADVSPSRTLYEKLTERDVSLPEASAGSITIYADTDAPQGYVRVYGDVPEGTDEDSPVYVRNAAGIFETCLTSTGFSTLVPLAQGPWSAAVYMDGALSAFDGQ